MLSAALAPDLVAGRAAEAEVETDREAALTAAALIEVMAPILMRQLIENKCRSKQIENRAQRHQMKNLALLSAVWWCEQ